MSTTQLDSCIKVIETTMEYPSDDYLIKLVKIQRLAQTISTTMAADSKTPMSLPLVMVVESFQDQLDTFRASLPPHLSENPTLLCHVFVAETLLRDFAISDQRCSPENMQVSDRLQLLWSCIKSLNEVFTVRFAAPEIEKPRFLCIIASDLAYTIITGIKLLTLRLPGWDLNTVTQKLDLVTVLGKVIDQMLKVITKRKSGLLSPDRCDIEDPLERLVRLMKTARELVSMHTSCASPLTMLDNMSNVAWREFMGDVAWGVDEAHGMLGLATQS
ncbi:hypothetical protein UVI_02046700 [Ustilaginoidea virens]|nr:hypothetical protein UVI_02046700 [Ustilaginoidea virens]